MNKLKLYSLFLFLVLMSLGNSLSAQNLFFNWVDADGGIGEDFVSDVAVDANGNIYAVGSFSGTVIFDSTLANGTLYATGNLDIFVSKTNKYGTLLWVKKIGGNDDDIASSIALDSNNNIYITGSFQGTCDFNPSVSATYIASAINGTSDIFVCKLNTNGNFAWVANIDGDKIPDIAIDADNNILATGTFSTDVDFDPGTGIFNIPATDETIFIWKLSSSGSFIWANEIDGNASSDNGYGIAVDANKNVYVTGSFQIAVDCDPAGSGYFLYSNGSLDVFIAKFNAAGALHWAKSIGGGASDEGLYVEIDNENNLYLSGIFSNVVDFDPSGGGTVNLGSKGAQDVFLLKLDSTGTFKWANSIGSASADGCGSIKSDSENGQVICGYFQDTLKLDAPNDTIHLISNGSIDAFFARYDSLGNLSWAYSFGGSNDDVAKAVGVQYPSNQIVLAGSFTSSNMDFDPDTSSVYRSTKGGSDGFVSRFNRCFKDSLITIIGCDSVVGPSGNKSWYATGIYLDTIFSGCGGYAYVVNAIIPIDTANAISIKSCVGYAVT